MIHFNAAIFDLDGTLLDSMPVWENIAVDYLCSVDIQPKENVQEAVRAMSIQQACEHFCAEYGLKLTPEEINAGINRLIEDFYLNRVSLKPGVKEALESLRRRGVRMCVATATDRYLVEGALAHTGILPYFDFIITCTEAGAGKDRPDIFLKALDRLGASLDDTVIFEDALYAVRTAKAAGFTVVALYDEAAKEHQAEIKRLADAFYESFETWLSNNEQ
jgi:HAD superfamily hydrolase (TIGR01509 family)